MGKRVLVKDTRIERIVSPSEAIFLRARHPLFWLDAPDHVTMEWTYNPATGLLVAPPLPPGPLPDVRAEAMQQLDTLIERARAAALAELVNAARKPAGLPMLTTDAVLAKIKFYLGRV